jgi:hypothetical protein
MDTDSYLSWAVDLGFLWMPPFSCACAWWFSLRDSPNIGVSRWLRATTWTGLLLATLSIVFGAFALGYWRRHPEGNPPYPTFVTTYIGAALALLSLPFALLATSWNRVALVLCSLGLLGFYFVMFLSP